MLSTSNLTLPEIPSLGDWTDIIKTEETDSSPKLTRAHSLQRNLTKRSEEGDIRNEVINIATTDPSHLFWVPASQHPEIAPTEFESYVDAHELMVRRKSVKRRQSVLSVYFTASDSKEQASNEPQQKNLLRRSVSVQLPKTNEAQSVPDFLVFDRNSSPLDESQAIVPKAADGRALHRRGARTKNFRKNTDALQRPELVSRKSESDSLPLERVTLVDDRVNEEKEPEKEEIQDLGIGESEPPVGDGSPSATTASSRKSSWSWSFWSEEKSRKNKVDPIEVKQTSKSTDIPRRFTLSSIFSRKSKNNTPTQAMNEKDGLTAPKDFQLNKMCMTRLPLHVERAIYKLSHVKLANSRRPLKEQVLISNLMFWYLSIISNTEQKQIQPRKMMGKKKRPQKKPIKSNNKPALMSNNTTSRHQSTGFIVPENYLNPKQHPAKKITHKQMDSSSDEDDDDDDDDSLSSDSDSDDDNNISFGRKQKEDDLPLALYKAKK